MRSQKTSPASGYRASCIPELLESRRLMSVDAFLELPGVTGGSSAPGFKHDIVVTDVTLAAPHTVIGSRGNTITEPPSSIALKTTDRKASKQLQEACATGKYFPAIQITFTEKVHEKVDEKPEPYLKYTMSDVIVTSVTFSRGEHGAGPSESIGLNFSNIEISYAQ